MWWLRRKFGESKHFLAMWYFRLDYIGVLRRRQGKPLSDYSSMSVLSFLTRTNSNVSLLCEVAFEDIVVDKFFEFVEVDDNENDEWVYVEHLEGTVHLCTFN
jgi:hypothetical protein